MSEPTPDPIRRPAPAVALLAVLLAGPAGAAGQDALGVPVSAPAAAVFDSIARTPPLGRAHWGIAVYDVRSGRPLLRRNADRLFVPASNMKLVTAAAAMELLGPDYRFRTRIEARPGRDGVADSLVVFGAGDPTLGAPFHDPPRAALDSLADSLAAAGLRRVAGPIVIDQSRFDSTLVHPAWENFDLDWYYAAPVAPFAVMAGAYEVVVSPGPPGRPARVSLPYAADLVGVDAGIRTVPGDDPWDDELRRVPPDSLVLRGTIGAGAGPDTSWIAQTDPGLTAGRALARALERRGIAAGPVRVRHRPPGGTDPRQGDPPPGEESALRVAWRSPPLVEIIPLVLERSDNWISELLLRTLGAELGEAGGWSEGTRVLEEYLAGIGIDPEAHYLRDGSGLTPQNLVTPDALATLLLHVSRQAWADAFRAAMVQPGEPEGTLEERLPDHRERVWAKTGTIRHVNALSGFVRTADDRELAFSILSNASGRPAREVRTAIDRIVQALIENGS